MSLHISIEICHKYTSHRPQNIKNQLFLFYCFVYIQPEVAIAQRNAIVIPKVDKVVHSLPLVFTENTSSQVVNNVLYPSQLVRTG